MNDNNRSISIIAAVLSLMLLGYVLGISEAQKSFKEKYGTECIQNK